MAVIISQGHWYIVKGHGLEAPEIRLIDDEPDRPVWQYIVAAVIFLYIRNQLYLPMILKQQNCL